MERLLVTANLKWWQVIYNHELYFDSILYAHKLRQDMWEDRYNRSHKPLWCKTAEQMQLPIKRHTDEVLLSYKPTGKKKEHYNDNSGVWLASEATVKRKWEQKIYINKRFDSLTYEKRWGIQKKKVYTTMGKYKNYQIPRKIIFTPWVSWVVIGDQQQIRDMVQDIHHIGKETNIGYGEIASWDIEPTDKLWRRHFPSRHILSYEKAEYKRCLPPYSSTEYKRECTKRFF